MQLVYNTVLLGKIYAIKYLETTLTSMKIATIKTMTMTAFVIFFLSYILAWFLS